MLFIIFLTPPYHSAFNPMNFWLVSLAEKGNSLFIFLMRLIIFIYELFYPSKLKTSPKPNNKISTWKRVQLPVTHKLNLISHYKYPILNLIIKTNGFSSISFKSSNIKNNTSISVCITVYKIIIYHPTHTSILYITTPILFIALNYPSHIKAILKLYQRRQSGLIPFSQPFIYSFNSVNCLKDFKLNGNNIFGGIYLIQYKLCPDIYYIGRAINFKERLQTHYRRSLLSSHNKNNTLYSFINSIGWKYFTINIVEILPLELNLQIKVEYDYLNKNLPILNSIYNTGNNIAPKQKLSYYRYVEMRKINAPATPKTKTKIFPIYVYSFDDSNSLINFIGSFPSYDAVLSKFSLSKISIYRFINTDLPIQNLLFYSYPINDLKSAYCKTSKLLKDHGFTEFKTNTIEVWVYYKTENNQFKLLNNKPFKSISDYAEYLQLSFHPVKENLNSLKPDLKKGFFSFTQPITEVQIQTILTEQNYLKPKTTILYAYDEKNLNLVNGKPFDSIKFAAEYFKVHRTSIFRHTDTMKPSFKINGQCYYFLRQPISKELKAQILAKIK